MPGTTEMTLSSDHTDRFLDSLNVNGASPNTIRAYRADLLGWMEATKTNPPMTTTDLETSAATYLTTGRKTWAPKTTQRKLGAMRSFAKWQGHPTFLASYRAPKPARSVPHPLPGRMADIDALLLAAGTDRQSRGLVALLGLCGLRISEALSIRPGDIDRDRQTLTVRGKGDVSRVIPISAKAWCSIQPLLDGRVSIPSVPLVGPWDERKARARITKLGEAAGISRRISSHDLRATLATCAYEHTRDLRVVQEILGHASSHTTEIYTGVTDRSMREAVSF